MAFVGGVTGYSLYSLLTPSNNKTLLWVFVLLCGCLNVFVCIAIYNTSSLGAVNMQLNNCFKLIGGSEKGHPNWDNTEAKLLLLAFRLQLCFL